MAYGVYAMNEAGVHGFVNAEMMMEKCLVGFLAD
jgi:hypothetical protein